MIRSCRSLLGQFYPVDVKGCPKSDPPHDVDRCAPRIEFFARAIALWDRAATEAEPDLRELLDRRGPRLARVGRTALLHIGARPASGLSDDDADRYPAVLQCKSARDLAVPGAGDEFETDDIVPILDRPMLASRRTGLLARLPQLGNACAVDLLRRELNLPFGQVQVAVAVLGAMGSDARAAVPELVQTAKRFPLRRIREQAYQAVLHIAGGPVEGLPAQSAQRCPPCS